MLVHLECCFLLVGVGFCPQDSTLLSLWANLLCVCALYKYFLLEGVGFCPRDSTLSLWAGVVVPNIVLVIFVDFFFFWVRP